MSKGTFVKGLVLGALAGATAGILFAPKSGKETREDIKNKAVELTGKAKELYADSQKAIAKKIANLKKAGKIVDKAVYADLVDGVVAELKNDGKVATDTVSKLGTQLKADWDKVVKTINA